MSAQTNPIEWQSQLDVLVAESRIEAYAVCQLMLQKPPNVRGALMRAKKWGDLQCRIHEHYKAAAIPQPESVQ